MYVLHAVVGALNYYLGIGPDGSEAYLLDKESPNLLKFSSRKEASSYAEEHRIHARISKMGW